MKASERKIRKVAVLGSGVMGSRLACHFANIGLDVVLLDIVPFDLKDEEKDKPEARNRIVNEALKSTLKSNPSPIYQKSFANRIKTGNFDDNLDWIADCDWVLEAIIERLDIKQTLFEKVEKHRKPGSLITSNTSGIPIEMMLEGRSDDFQANFCGTHFFNPPRYLRLLEIIPSTKTDPEVIDFFMDYGDRFLGKQTVLCKDTPAFIANRVGVFSICAIFKLIEEFDLTIDEVDSLTGPLTGRPKSATFRTCDVVGLDTMIKVATGVYDNCTEDERRDIFKVPDYVLKMEENGWLGDKTKQGFYKKTKDEDGKRQIMSLDLKTLEYGPKQKPKFASVANAKQSDDLKDRIKILNNADDKAGQFLRTLGFYLYEYVSRRIPEISDELYRLDDAMKAGFGWEIGAFEQWDVVGVARTVEAMKEAGFSVAPWIEEMIAGGFETFYKIEDGVKKYYDQNTKAYVAIPGLGDLILLDNFRQQSPVFTNNECTLHDIGDGVLNLEFHSKMNSIGSGILSGINQAIEIAEDKGYKGLVIGNEGPNFSAGANIGLIFMLAVEQEYDELNFAIKYFQDTMMRVRHSAIPVVAGPHGLTLGGGCELTMHSDAAVCAAETYIGLVEVGVGVIPGGGGTKEMALRASDAYYTGDPQIPTLSEKFISIATAKVGTSAYEGIEVGVVDPKKDTIVVNSARVIAEAKQTVIDLSDKGYVQPPHREDITVLGRTGLGAFYAGSTGFNIGAYASEHDLKIANKLAWVLCGGDLTQQTQVSEQYLLDLEREAFLSLCGEKKTLERLQSILTTGKPLRN